jgi:hypothetical protein
MEIQDYQGVESQVSPYQGREVEVSNPGFRFLWPGPSPTPFWSDREIGFLLEFEIEPETLKMNSWI